MGPRRTTVRSVLLAALLPAFPAAIAIASQAPVRAAGVRLEVSRASGAQTCPDEPTLREGVISRLGYDPFTQPVARVVLASFEGSSHGYSATVIMKDPQGRPLGLQELSYQLANCDELAAAIELAIAVALDPLAVKPQAAVGDGAGATGAIVAAMPIVAANPTAISTPTATATATTNPTATTTAEVQGGAGGHDLLVYAGVEAVFLATPSTVPALSAGVELRSAHVSLGLELQGNFAGHEAVGASSIGVSQLLAVLVPCYHWGFFGACGVIAAGAQQSSSTGLDPSLNPTTPYFALGARVAADLPLASWLWVRPQADLWFPTNRTNLQVAGVTEWRTPAVSPTIGVALVVPIR
jgi:hypothetical protein